MAYTERCPDRHGAIAKGAGHISLAARIWGNLAGCRGELTHCRLTAFDAGRIDIGQAASRFFIRATLSGLRQRRVNHFGRVGQGTAPSR
jgi:hypothetical protein